MGSGFLYHHIRLMIGAAVGVAIKTLPEQSIQQALTLPYVHQLPLAPASPLVLTNQIFKDSVLVHFDKPYLAERGSEGSNPTSRMPYIVLMDESGLEREQDFWKSYLLPEMTSQIQQSQFYDEWHHELNQYHERLDNDGVTQQQENERYVD